jgi:hypothetical protein
MVKSNLLKKTFFCEIRHVWKLILDQKMDDVKSGEIKKGLKMRIDKFMVLFFQSVEETGKRLNFHLKFRIMW